MLLADKHGKQDKCCLTLYSILTHFDAFVENVENWAFKIMVNFP